MTNELREIRFLLNTRVSWALCHRFHHISSQKVMTFTKTFKKWAPHLDNHCFIFFVNKWYSTDWNYNKDNTFFLFTIHTHTHTLHPYVYNILFHRYTTHRCTQRTFFVVFHELQFFLSQFKFCVFVHLHTSTLHSFYTPHTLSHTDSLSSEWKSISKQEFHSTNFPHGSTCFTRSLTHYSHFPNISTVASPSLYRNTQRPHSPCFSSTYGTHTVIQQETVSSDEWKLCNGKTTCCAFMVFFCNKYFQFVRDVAWH